NRPPYENLAEPQIETRITELIENPEITMYLSSSVESIDGQPGKFEVGLRVNGDLRTVTVGAVVLATGWKPYDPAKLGHYGLGKYANVITSVTLEEMALLGKITRPSDGREIQSVAILQCESAKDESHLPYSGNVTSLITLKQAVYLRERHPNA